MFIKTSHSLVLYVIILVSYILLDNYVFITISFVTNSRLVITIPQVSNARSVLLVTMATPPKERLKTENRVRVLWWPIQSVRTSEFRLIPAHPWEAHGSSFLSSFNFIFAILFNTVIYENDFKSKEKINPRIKPKHNLNVAYQDSGLRCPVFSKPWVPKMLAIASNISSSYAMKSLWKLTQCKPILSHLIYS